MKPNWRIEWIHWLVIAAMFITAAVVWSQAPDKIPVHWNIRGEVDRYGGKFEGLLLIPLITLALYGLLLFLPRLDPGRANYAQFQGAYHLIRLYASLFLAGIYGVVLKAAFGRPIRMQTVIPLMLGVLFIILGNVMGKIRPNWFVGIRTPWTLSSKASWTKTHRLGGWLFIVMGLAWITALLLRNPTHQFLVGGAVSAVALIWMVIYSYLVYRKDSDRQSPAGTRPANESEKN